MEEALALVQFVLFVFHLQGKKTFHFSSCEHIRKNIYSENAFFYFVGVKFFQAIRILKNRSLAIYFLDS